MDRDGIDIFFGFILLASLILVPFTIYKVYVEEEEPETVIIDPPPQVDWGERFFGDGWDGIRQ